MDSNLTAPLRDRALGGKPMAALLLIAPFFFWGTAMVAMKGVIPDTTPLFMAGVRLVPAGVMVLGVGMLMGRPQPKGWAAWLWILLFALVDGALFQGFLAEGLVRTGAGLGSVMIDSQPLAVALLALWLFGERIGSLGVAGATAGGHGHQFARPARGVASGSLAAAIAAQWFTGRHRFAARSVSERSVADAAGSAIDGSRHRAHALRQPSCRPDHSNGVAHDFGWVAIVCTLITV